MTLQNTYIFSFITNPSDIRGGGYGNWFWVLSSGQGQLFQLGNTTPQLTNFFPYIIHGPILAAFDATNPQVTIYDLSGSSVSSRVTILPSIEGVPKTVAAYSTTQLVVSNQYGVVLDGATGHAFNYGKALAIAGSYPYAVVETASGQSFIFDANGTQVLATSFAPASFTISQNGNTLGSIISPASASFYSLPSMNLIASPSGVVSSINLSANGQYAGIGSYAGNTASGELIGLPGSITSIPVIADNPEIFPSPDGSLVAAPNQPHGSPDQTTTTAIYHSNGSLVTVVSGNPEGWIDSNSLLVGTYTNTAPPDVMVFYNTSVIYDAAGNVKLTFPQNTLPQLQPPQFIGANEVYQAGSIYSLVTGGVEWNWPSLSNSYSAPSAVVGSGVIFSLGGEISLFPR